MTEVKGLYRFVLVMVLVAGIASIIGITSFAQHCSSCLPIQNIRIENRAANPRIEFELTRWCYVYFFQYRPGVGWEALYPIVASQVEKYGPGCHTVYNGLLRHATCVRVVVSDKPVFIYPESAYKIGAMLTSYIQFVPTQSYIETLEFRVEPSWCRTPPRSSCCIMYKNTCCNACCDPCLIPLWLFLLIVAH